MADDKPKPDPKPLSTEYHRAHKQLMLWSAILFIWELVGIDLEKAKETGGNAGAIISAIKSPQAVPWALMILVAYFLFKTTIEWYQCSSQRRTLRVARIDFVTAWIVSITAYALYAFQAIKKVQFADVLQKDDKIWGTLSFMVGLTIGLMTIILLEGEVFDKIIRRRFPRFKHTTILMSGFLLVFLVGLLLMVWWIQVPNSWYLLGTFLLGVGVALAIRVSDGRKTGGKWFSKRSRSEE